MVRDTSAEVRKYFEKLKESAAEVVAMRMYTDAKGDVGRAKQRVLHFLPRRGIPYTASGNWTGGTASGCKRMAARVEQVAREERYTSSRSGS